MAVGTYNIQHHQGDTLGMLLTWKDEDDSLVDLTGYTARMQLRPSVDSDEITLELTTENGRITLGDAAGTIELDVDATDTAAILVSTYRYDLEMVNGSNVRKLIKGRFKMLGEVTRA